MEAVLQDREACRAPPAELHFPVHSSLMSRLKALALLVLVVWSLPVSLVLAATAVVRDYLRLQRSGRTAQFWHRVQSPILRTSWRGTAVVSGARRQHSVSDSRPRLCPARAAWQRSSTDPPVRAVCRGQEHQGAARVPPAAPRWLARDSCGHTQVRDRTSELAPSASMRAWTLHVSSRVHGLCMCLGMCLIQ